MACVLGRSISLVTGFLRFLRRFHGGHEFVQPLHLSPQPAADLPGFPLHGGLLGAGLFQQGFRLLPGLGQDFLCLGIGLLRRLLAARQVCIRRRLGPGGNLLRRHHGLGKVSRGERVHIRRQCAFLRRFRLRQAIGRFTGRIGLPPGILLYSSSLP